MGLFGKKRGNAVRSLTELPDGAPRYQGPTCRLALSDGALVFEWYGPGSEFHEPRRVPLGAIRGTSIDSDSVGLPMLFVHLHGHPDTHRADGGPYKLWLDRSTPVEPFLRQLRAHVSRAAVVSDFDTAGAAARRRPARPAGTPKDTPVLDWLQGG